MKPELRILPFASQKEWADWLAKQNDKSIGVWVKIAKKDSGLSSVTYAEALDIALCYGWIDGQKRIFNPRWMRMRKQKCFLPLSIARTDMQSCLEYKLRRKPRRAPDGLKNSF